MRTLAPGGTLRAAAPRRPARPAHLSGRDLPQVRYVAADGEPIRLAADDLGALPLPGMQPVRDVLKLGRGLARSGQYWSATERRYWTYESGLERDRFQQADFDPHTVALVSQPMQLVWSDRMHVPDALLIRADASRLLVDCRHPAQIDTAAATTFTATARMCAQLGWGYRVLGPLVEPYRSNLRFIAAYRHPRCRNAELATQLAVVFAEPLGLRAGAELFGDPLRVLPALYHELWAGRLRLDLDRPMRSDSLVRAGGET